MIWIVLATLVLASQMGTLLALWVNARRSHDLATETIPESLRESSAPGVLVVVPARNEEAHIGACVSSILASTYPSLRLRVVDDKSTDRTGAILRELAKNDGRLEVIAGEELPAGWLGKNFACSVGARGATAQFILFIDADLRVSPEAVSKAVAAAERTRSDLLCAVPKVEALSFWERAVQPLVTLLICAFTPIAEVNSPERKEAAATGPFMLFRRSAYEAIGGHASVRAEVVEDLRLAERIKEARLKLVFGRAPTLLSLRMYDSLSAIVRGWSKNFHVALGRALFLAPVFSSLLILCFAGPFVLPPFLWASGANAAALLASLAGICAVASRLLLHRHYRVTRRGIFLMPLGALVLGWILVRSAHRAMTGRAIDWKGRKVV